jgi:hypothetical protein
MIYILTDDTGNEYLSDDAQTASRLRVRVEKAEARVISHYREDAAVAGTPLVFDGQFGSKSDPGIVQLRGWEEDADGDPDTTAMPDDLVRRLRIVISDVVEWRLRQQDREGIESKSEGSRSVSYDKSESTVPTRLFDPLEKYDQREPFSGRW